MENITSKSVHHFFATRASDKLKLDSTMLNSKDLSEKRNEHEQKLILPLLELNKNKTGVLDIGCGVGRWASTLKNKVKHYIGTDFVDEYTKLCNQEFKNSPCKFYNMDVLKTIDNSNSFPQCNLIIINGLCVYLNDDIVTKLFKFLSSYLPNGGEIYLRESVSITRQRKTLKDFYSKELGTVYNAIYRTVEEYKSIIDEYLVPQGINVTKSDFLLTKELSNRKETSQYYWILKKGM